MASIREHVKDKKIVSFRIRICVGRDEHSKQVFRTLTWHPPPNLTNAKARKLAQAYATQWEQEQRDQFLLEQAELIQKREIEAHRVYTFDSFVNDVWLPLRVRDGAHRPSTIAMYGYMLKVITPHFQGLLMTDITGIMITTYLRWLRNDYRTNRGLPLADKTIKHHYNLLGMIFNYAEKQDVISKNPMKKVDPPLVRRKEVDALSEDDAQRFFKALESCPFEFRCILHLLATTGLRRGECVGLQWQDIDFEKATLSVKRSATYTKEFGISVAEPKTPKSKRTIPLMPSTLRLLAQLKAERSKRYPYTVLALSFVFCREGKPFEARDPNAITRHMKRFIRAAGLPDVSPHDLRHTCATLLLSSGADIKSVQEILGHTDARTTLNFYVKADLSQMRVATDKYAKAFGL